MWKYCEVSGISVKCEVSCVHEIVHCSGISRDHWHKRRATGGKRAPIRKKRKYELGRPAANTKVG